jgi:polyisoprenoid-binding protein YceI
MTFSKLFFACLSILFFVACNNAPEGQKATTSAPVKDVQARATTEETYTVNAAASRVNWQGTEPSGDGHTGTIGITTGSLQVSNGQLVGGTFVLDMNSISATDLKPGKGKEDLESHLKDGDFFDVQKFPTGTFLMTQVLPSTEVAGATHRVSGNLTLRNQTQNITFPAHIQIENGKFKATTPKFTIDRTKWGVMYRSGVIGTIKNKLINDQIGLEVTLEAAK